MVEKRERGKMGKNTEKKREGLGVWNKRWKGSEGKDEVGKYKAKRERKRE